MDAHTHLVPMKTNVKNELIINCVINFLAVAVVILRVVSRLASGAKLWWDDYFIIFALPLGTGMTVISGIYGTLGAGYHIDEVIENLTPILKLMLAYAFIFSAAIGLIKISVLCFYLRVFVNESMRLASKIVLAVVILWDIANLIALLLLCRPIEANWHPLMPGSKCDSPQRSFIEIGAFNVISDVIIVLLPLPTIWSLNTAKNMKIGLTVVFLAGLIVSVVAICRIYVLTLFDINDISGTTTWVSFLSPMEVNLSIFCVSLPMLAPLCARWKVTRGASKLSKYEHELELSERSERYSRGLGLAAARAARDDPMLETIYAHNMDTHHTTMVSASRGDHGSRTGSHDGSEANDVFGAHPGSLEKGGAILVQNEWDIRRH